jgi:hypothetical protein
VKKKEYFRHVGTLNVIVLFVTMMTTLLPFVLVTRSFLQKSVRVVAVDVIRGRPTIAVQ